MDSVQTLTDSCSSIAPPLLCHRSETNIPYGIAESARQKV